MNHATCIFGKIRAENPLSSHKVQIRSKDDLKACEAFAETHKEQLIIGYLSYDIGYVLHDIPHKAHNDLKLPDIYLYAFNTWQTYRPPKIPQRITGKNFEPQRTAKDYEKAYKKIMHYIHEGDVYQINFTHRLKAYTHAPALNVFEAVAKANPVELLAYFEGTDADGNPFEIISASPERFIQIKNHTIETFPIKGTRPRGKTKKQEEARKAALLNSPKETAELNMITDLLRNDIGKISESGSVKVKAHRKLKKCPTVWHTYSHIIGTLKKGYTPLKALLEMMPGGSITGCPKKRAMEIIDELEPTQRALYTGTIFCILPGGTELDSSIAIRTIIKKGPNLYLQVGGGIVADSTSRAEFQETLDKAASFMNIITPQ